MIRGLYTTVSAMAQLQAKQSVTVNNMANANTTGYKSEILLAKSFDEMMISNRDRYSNGTSKKQELGGLSLGVNIDETLTKHIQGNLIESNSETAFAIVGDGMFSVEKENGEIAYTRDGDFKVGADGYLVTTSGHYVLGLNTLNGNRERIYIGDYNNISINNDNNILIDGEERYKFNIVGFNDYNTLNKTSDNLYTGNGGRRITDYTIQHRYIEGSNVDVIQETTDLMATLRAFEANQSVVKAIDSTLQLIANDIGKI
ncbi:MAG: flagellar hook-basal body complex protein [Romboutsia sp.]|nr:flagellar hook-basal body complex protein [Romboutsia sp.]